MNLLSYFKKGLKLQKITPELPPTGSVFLIHGWGVRGDSMRKIAKFLQKNNYEIYNYDYPSSKFNIEKHAELFLANYREAIKNINLPIYFVTHSMGGLILRCAMNKMTENECRQIKFIVMLGTPNKGSFWGRFGDNKLVRFFNASLGDMSDLPHSFVNNIPLPACFPQVGIIGGSRDFKVAAKNLVLPSSVNQKIIMVKSSHPGLRISPKALELTLQFLQNNNQ